MGLSESDLTEGERIVLSFHPHWRRMILPVLALVLTIAAAVGLFLVIPSGESFALFAYIAVGVVGLVALIVLFLVPFLKWKTTAYVLTTHRFNITKGLLSKSSDDLPHFKINTVKSDQTVMERILGAGTLIVESAGERGELTFKDIPRVQVVRTELFRRLEDAADGTIDEK